jgi:hypothetical protein
MLKIKELSGVVDMAQDNKFDEYIYYNPVNQSIELELTYDVIEEEYIEEDKEELIPVVVSPFGRDMFLTFFETIEHPTVRNMFFDKFHGAKKYRKVKDLFPRYHLLERFYKFKDEYELNIAKKWCEAYKIPYIDESGNTVTF